MRALPAILLLGAAVLAGGCSLGSSDNGPPTWAPAGKAKIRPGVQTHTQGGQCTANFVFYDKDTVYLGQSAHCASTGGESGTNGCTTGSRPLGTQVTIEGASKPGTLA